MIIAHSRRVASFLGLILTVSVLNLSAADWWSDDVNKALDQAGTNRQELVQALQRTTQDQREGMQFLIANMPSRDLKNLTADFLVDNVTLAYAAFAQAPWASSISTDMFLNDVLPYASVTEARESWRTKLRELSAPMVKDCKTPGEAAQKINQQLFKLVNVRYSTSRRAPDQAPSETMATGVATCTGLSILLVDACRSVGVPARVAGTPMWSDNRGNHTWVEIWDDGRWHYAGAAEADPNGLDRGWFGGSAAQAIKDDARHAIYASSFKKTGVIFPLAWSRRADYVNAVNVTDRYAKPHAENPTNMTLMINVLDHPGGKRVASLVTVTDSDNSDARCTGTSKEEPADMNDHLSFEVPRQHHYVIEARLGNQSHRQTYAANTDAHGLVTLFLTGEIANPHITKLIVSVLDRPAGKRVAAKVVVTDTTDPSAQFEGTSKETSMSRNDGLVLEIPKKHTFIVHVEYDGQKHQQYYTSRTNAQDNLTVFLGGYPPVRPPSATHYTSPPITEPLSAKDAANLKAALTAYFCAPASDQATMKFPSRLEKLLRNNEPAVRRAAWEAFCAAPIHAASKEDMDANQVRSEQYLSPYVVKTVGTRPPNGWPLFIAMHGGGGAPQELNDSQWRIMQGYYRDHPEVGGYLYLALRAPNNSWNGFYTGYVYPLIAKLIDQFLIFGDVDPNKVFIMGYSHGGYGAFAIGPKMPDRFAAIHSSAGAPADGIVPQTLRNTVFTFMVGGEDSAYGRRNLDVDFSKKIDDLRGDRTDIFPVSFQLVPDNPHTGLPDRDKIAEMYHNVRNPVPRDLTWVMTDNVIHDFFWLNAPSPGGGKEIDALCRDNHLTVTTRNDVTAATILLDSRLIDFKKPVTLEFNGQTSTHKLRPSLRTLCETMQRRGDPELAFTAQIDLPPPDSSSHR
jgi:transglutaminase-like putative cysteine protease/pimeloyl-ACP methyl ester carboxylesterase